MTSDITAIVLAAGHGTRMKSSLNKVLHPIAGRPLVFYPVQAALEAGASKVVVVVGPTTQQDIEGYLRSAFGAERIRCVVQDPPRGTGDAARVGMAEVASERVLIFYGDTPLIRAEDLRAVVAALDTSGTALALLTCQLDEPTGYGRVLRDAQGQVLEIREQRDLRSDEERAIREVNPGVYAGRASLLREALRSLRPNNAQGEYYLTDVVAFARQSGGVRAVAGNPEALVGVNDRLQLVAAEAEMYARIAAAHARSGVTIRGDARIDQSVQIEPDVTLEGGVHLRGSTVVKKGTVIDTGCVVTDSEIGPSALLRPYTVVLASKVGPGAQVGPFAHLRPGSEVGDSAHVGNFVELKNTRLQRGAKANHLAYLGDGEVGEGANVGAGTIFCNYDGFQKHRTVIGAGAFIGSDSQIVAPVRVGDGAYVATGTTVTEDVPDDALAIGRTRQQNKPAYASKLRARLAAAAQKAKAGK